MPNSTPAPAALAFPLILLGVAQGQTPLCAGMANGPTIVDTTAASCVYDAATQSAVVTLNRDTVLDWERVDQRAGSSVTFQFITGANGGTVLNRLGALPNRQRHVFDGALSSNGRIVILSPTSEVKIGGSITASEVVAVVSDTSAAGELALLQGGQSVLFEDTAAVGTAGGRLLTLSGGTVTSTSGDVVLGAGQLVNLSPRGGAGGTVNSAGATRVFSGSSVSYNPTSTTGEALTPLPMNESNAIFHTGAVTAGSDIEMRVGDGGQLLVTGALDADAGAGRIFLKVKNGEIDLNPNANLAGILETSGTLRSLLYEGSESDTPGARSPSVSLFPSLRKDGAAGRRGERSESVKVIEGAPVVASSQARRKAPQATSQTAQAAKPRRSGKALVQRSGFFGLRSAEVSKRE